MEIKTSFSKSAPQPGKHFRNRSITSLDISNLLLVQRPRAPFPRDSIANTLLRTGHCHISASQSESSFGREIVQLPFKYHIVVVFNKLSSWGKSLRKRNRLSVVAPQIYRFLESSGRLNEGGEFLFYFYAIKDGHVYSHHKDLFRTTHFRFYRNAISETNTYELEPMLCKVKANELVSRDELADRLAAIGYERNRGSQGADFHYVLSVEVENAAVVPLSLACGLVDGQNSNDAFSPHSPKLVG